MTHRLFVIVHLAGIFLLPLIYWPKAIVEYEIPKVWFFIFWVETLFVLSLFITKKMRFKVKFDYILLLPVIFMAVTVVASIAGSDVNKSIFGNYWRWDGLITLFHLIILFYLTAFYISWHQISGIIKTIYYSNTVVSVFVLLSYIFLGFGLPVDNFFGIIGGSFGNPNFLAGYLTVSLPLSVGGSFSVKTGWKYFWLVIQIVAIFISRSWAATLLTVVYILLLQKQWAFRRQNESVLVDRNKSKPILKTLLVLLILLAAGYLYFQQWKFERDIPQDGFIAESRERIYYKGILAFIKKPYTGWGWANFDYAFESVVWPMKINDDVYVDKAHSQILEVAVTTGIVGAVVYLAFVIIVLKRLLLLQSMFRNMFLSSFFLFIIHSQTNVISISEEILFWLIAGISLRFGAK